MTDSRKFEVGRRGESSQNYAHVKAFTGLGDLQGGHKTSQPSHVNVHSTLQSVVLAT